MSDFIKATLLAKRMGMSRYTIRDICRRDTTLAFKQNGHYYIRLDELAKRPGFDLVGAMLASRSKWIKAVDLARVAGVPRRTIANWARTRPNFAKRIGRVYYVDLEALGASDEQIRALRKWAPNKRNLLNLMQIAGALGKLTDKDL